jgi:GGDEF domain-containing protein
VLLTGIRSISEAELIGATVVSNVSAPAMVGTESMLVSASVGVCTYPEGGSDGDSLLQVVDAEMYKAKAGGRNTFSVYTRGQVTIQRQG